MTSVTRDPLDTAKRFLQTVVVVDDNAYKRQEPGGTLQASLGDETLDSAAEPSAHESEPEVDLDELDPQAFDTETIVEGFADLGMNCAVIAPSPLDGERDVKRLRELAGRSDVVILDWVIRPRGAKVVEEQPEDRTSLSLLIDVLRRDAETGGSRLRLICVYTGERDLAEILDKIESTLKEQLASSSIERADPRLTVGPARIVLLGKEPLVSIPGLATVSAAQLPAEIVREFTEFVASGLLPEIALESLSAVRDQSHRLLRRFSGRLDPALLSHRSVTSPADAEQFVLALVGSELAAIVAAANATSPLRDERVAAFVSAAFDGRQDAYYWKNAVAPNPVTITKDNAVKALTLGIDASGQIREGNQKLDSKISRSSLLLTGDDPSEIRNQAIEIDMGFSALSSLARDRAFDGGRVPTPELQLGTLLKVNDVEPESKETPADRDDAEPDEQTYRYWLCLQPLCDCVRLTKMTAFPLLPLRPPSQSNSKFEFIVSEAGTYIPLQAATTKLSEIRLTKFQPDPQREVVLARRTDDTWEFEDLDGHSYEWLGSLRMDKAHKLLHSVATTAGRIGIDEYEFLRHASS
ncbi:MAG: hypothetical protein JWN95_1411 [Frankiales bacterium]|nr:hypothetical protein [Frankiales bacterium]